MSRYQAEVHLDPDDLKQSLADDVRRGLTARPKSLPPKYFYDSTGSALFERITRLPEYYLTRAEEQLLKSHASEVMDRLRPKEIVELGSGASLKIRWLLEVGPPPDALRYIPVDVDETAVAHAARRLLGRYPFLSVHGVIADVERHLERVPPAAGRRLVLFLGSTIGNFDAEPRRRLLSAVRGMLGPGGHFLFGVDLVKDPAVLERAYNDAAGVTAAFNRNILRVVNRGLAGDFQPDRFRHRACYNAPAGRIEMHLVPVAWQRVVLSALGLAVELSPAETIWTESSYKFTRGSVAAMLAGVGLGLDAWWTDGQVALAGAA
ncbi:MAG: L-histidine N(alpha)-methyltransferase [Candidatus Rokuibacteriota bacterium]